LSVYLPICVSRQFNSKDADILFYYSCSSFVSS